MSDNCGSTWPEQEAIEKWFDEYVREKYKIFHSNQNLMELKEAVTKPRIELQNQITKLEKVVDAAKKLYINSQEFYWNEEDGTYHASDVDDVHNLAEALSELNPQQEE